jgi:hypothetical protein
LLILLILLLPLYNSWFGSLAGRKPSKPKKKGFDSDLTLYL